MAKFSLVVEAPPGLKNSVISFSSLVKALEESNQQSLPQPIHQSR